MRRTYRRDNMRTGEKENTKEEDTLFQLEGIVSLKATT